jgi:hypothetical protein
MRSTQAFGKDTDYTKLLQHDVEEEEKVLHLCHHSKKSAIAFRLINKFGVDESLLPTGSGRFGCRGGRSKEADIGYKPRARDMEDDWPSFVVEVGVSESLAMLRRDAAFWITNSDGRTRIVLVLSVNWRDQRILVERWEEVPRTRPNWSIANYE